MQQTNITLSSTDIKSLLSKHKSFTHENSDWLFQTEIKKQTGTYYRATKINGMIGEINVGSNTIQIRKIEKDRLFTFEIEVLYKLRNNPYVKKFYGFGLDKNGEIYVYMEYIEGEISILEKLQLLVDKRFEETEILELAKKIITGLKFIHDNQIIHRDIKSETIQLIGDEIKFVDFCLSKFYNKADGSKYYSETGTDAYKAPEVKLQDNTAGRRSDIYSLGCVFIEMAGGDLKKRDDGGAPLIPNHLSYYSKNIIQHCLIGNPDARYTADQLFNKLFNLQPFPEKELLVLYLAQNPPLFESIPKDATNLVISSTNGRFRGLPASVTKLSLSSFNQEIEIDSIPSSVKYLDLGDDFDIQNNGDNIPDTILTLRCGFKFTKVLNLKSIPQSVTNLQLYNYNLPLAKNSIPKSVISLTLGSNFNDIDSLTNLPSSIIDLEFGTNDSNIVKLNDLLWGPTLNNSQNSTNNHLSPSTTSVIVNGIQKR